MWSCRSLGVKKPLRIKRFEAVPLDFEIETNAPLLVKLWFYGTFWRFVRLYRITFVWRGDPVSRPVWRLFYARVKWVRV